MTYAVKQSLFILHTFVKLGLCGRHRFHFHRGYHFFGNNFASRYVKFFGNIDGFKSAACGGNGSLAEGNSVALFKLLLHLSHDFGNLFYVLYLTVHHCAAGMRGNHAVYNMIFFVSLFAYNAYHGAGAYIQGKYFISLCLLFFCGFFQNLINIHFFLPEFFIFEKKSKTLPIYQRFAF